MKIKINNQGRVLIPKNLRTKLKLKDYVDIDIQDDHIIIKNHNEESIKDVLEKNKQNIINKTSSEAFDYIVSLIH